MGKVQRRRATAASARPPRTPITYGFAAPRRFSSFLRPLFSMVAHCVRLYPMPQPWMASATVGYGWIVLRLRRVAVRRGFRLFVEVGREVGGRHVYFVERGARERADELQSSWALRSCLSTYSRLSLEFPGEDNYLEYDEHDRRR